MKLHPLIPAVLLSMAVLVQAQSNPAPRSTKPTLKLTGEVVTAPAKPALNANEAGFAKYKTALNGDGSMTLQAGTVAEMIEEIRWRAGRGGYWPQVDGGGKKEMPNLVFGKGAREASVPGDVTLREVTPVQALALVVAAAGCTFKPISAPEEAAGQKPTIIGYKIELQPAPGFGSTGSNPFGSSLGGSGTSSRTSSPTSATSGAASIPTVRVVDHTGRLGSSTLGPRAATLSVDPVANPAGMLADNANPFVRVYAIGFIMAGTDQEKVTKVKTVDDLIRSALEEARLGPNLSLNIHERTGTLIVRATAAQHEIIEQAVKAMKENATQITAPAKP